MSETVRLRDFETEGLLSWNGVESLYAYMRNWMYQGRRKWRPHGILLPAEEQCRERAEVKPGKAGHRLFSSQFSVLSCQ